MSNDQMFFTRHIFCCTNERPADHPRGSCKMKGAEPLRNYMKARVKELGIENARVNNAGCLDRCELGPTLVVYPEGTWYTYASREDVEEIITALREGRVAERLVLTGEQKELRPDQKK
ncbi:MAG TPA: (2Fe-2S) ferredoxin domain-containing protein [Patescibacteria group bacterium]|nr:(2Fe-2S) ferredoxin domain-containing protein [Patescibacteria group bacterium]